MAKTSSTRFYNFYGKKGLAGGLNVSDDPLIVGPEEMTKATNVLVGQSLIRQKRPGLENYHTGIYENTASYIASGVPIRGIIQYWRYGSGTGAVLEDVFLHQDDKVWSVENRASEAINRTAALTLSTDGIPNYQVFEGILYFLSSNQGDGYCKWNGLAEPAGDAEAAVGPPDGDGKFLGIYAGRMLMAGNADFPFRVYVSSALDAELWTGLDATSFDLSYDGDPEGVTAILPEIEGRIYIATRRSVYELSCSDPSDVTTFSVRRVTRGVGCVGQGTVVATPNDILFASDRGVHSLKRVIVSDQSAVTFLSRDIQKLWTNLLNSSLLKQAQSTWDEVQNLYVITVPSSGQIENDVILALNLTYNYWMQWDTVEGCRALNTVLLSNRQYVLGGTEEGKIVFFNEDLSTDLGQGFAFNMKSGKFFPDSSLTNQFRFISVTMLVSVEDPSSIAIGWSIDSVDGTKTRSRSVQVGNDADLLGSSFVLGASRLGQGAFVPIRVSVEETGFNFQLEITAGGSSEINFLGWILEVEDADSVYT